MRTYTLPEPRDLERSLLRRLSGSTRVLAAWKTFPSGEFHVRVSEVEETVCVIGRTWPASDDIIRTLLLVDTLRRSGAKRITLVLPYFAYARQDRQMRPGDPISADCLTRLLACVGVDRIVTADLHSRRVIAGSPIPIESVSVIPDMAGALAAELAGSEFTVVSADYGGQERADRFARALGRKEGAVWIEKDRDAAGQVTAKRLVGRLVGKTAIIVDDILDTGATVREAVRLLRLRGCRKFYLGIVHPVFSPGAVQLVRRLKFKKILVSDALPAPAPVRRLRRVLTVSAAPRLAEAVEKKDRE